MKKVLFLGVCTLVLLSAGCKKIPVLSSGEEVIAEYDGVQVTTEEYYEELKRIGGVNILLSYIDELFFNQLYEDTEEITTTAEDYVAYLKEQYGDSFQEAILSQGFENEDELYNYILIDIKKENAALDYIKENITDKEIEKYYKDEIVGDIQASHILIAPDVTDDMTDEEIETAEKEALATAKEIIKKLNSGEDFAELAAEYSDDGINAQNGGNLGYFNRGAMVDAFEDAAYSLDIDEYSSEPVETDYGYHIILVTDKKEKPELDLVKDDVIDGIVEDMIEENENLKLEALEKVREENGFTIYDSNLLKEYNESSE